MTGNDPCKRKDSPFGLFGFLAENLDRFDDLYRLVTLLDRHPEIEPPLMMDWETTFFKRFFRGVETFANTYQLTDDQRVSLLQSGQPFDPAGRPVLDLFYVLLAASKVGLDADDRPFEELRCMFRFEAGLRLSVRDVISRILSVQRRKKYYVVRDDRLYCCLDTTAYAYDGKGGWEKRDYWAEIEDRLLGYDPSEPDGSPYRFGNGSVMGEIDEIGESEAIERYGTDAVIKALALF